MCKIKNIENKKYQNQIGFHPYVQFVEKLKTSFYHLKASFLKYLSNNGIRVYNLQFDHVKKKLANFLDKKWGGIFLRMYIMR